MERRPVAPYRHHGLINAPYVGLLAIAPRELERLNRAARKRPPTARRVRYRLLKAAISIWSESAVHIVAGSARFGRE